MNEWIHVVEREVARAVSRMAGLVRRGVITLASAGHTLQVEGIAGERFHDVELWQQFGLASRPPVGGHVAMIAPGGRGEHAIAVAGTDYSHRPADLADGDSALYGKSGSGQAQVRCCADGSGYARVADGKTFDIGGTSGHQLMLKGETVKADIIAFAHALSVATTVVQVAAAGGILEGAAASWLVSKARAS
jgi:phage gp45-like